MPIKKAAVKSIAHQKSSCKQNDVSDEDSNSNSDNNNSQEGSDDSDSDDDDHPVYVCLSEPQFRKLNDSIKHCIGRNFVDNDDGMAGTVVGIVREVRSKQLCFKYHVVGENENFDYMWVSALSDASVTWGEICCDDDDDDENDNDDNIAQLPSSNANTNMAKTTTKPLRASFSYVTSLAKSVFEDPILPDGQKRPRNGRRV